MRKTTLMGVTCLLFCLVLVCWVSATPVITGHAVQKRSISFAKISPSTSNDRFQTYFQPTSMTRIFTADDNGRTFTVSRGQVVLVQLDTNPSTGFGWIPTVSPGISVIKDSYQQSGNNRFSTRGPVVGAGGIRTWTLKMTSTGDQQFSAEYKQPWMPGAGHIYTIHFIVV
jgi:predicted secreted protein